MLVSPYPTRGCWQIHSAVVTKVAGRALDIAQGNCWAQSSAAGRRCQKDRNAPADTWPRLSARLCLSTNNGGRPLSRRQSHNRPDSLLNATPLASPRDSVCSSWLQRSVLVSGECVESRALCVGSEPRSCSTIRNVFPTAQTSLFLATPFSSSPAWIHRLYDLRAAVKRERAGLQLSFLSSPIVPARLHTRFVAYTPSVFCQALGRGFDRIFLRTPNTGPSLHRGKRRKKQTPETHSTDTEQTEDLLSSPYAAAFERCLLPVSRHDFFRA